MTTRSSHGFTVRARAIAGACLFLVSLTWPACFAQAGSDAPTQLLDHLAGDWTLHGSLGGKTATHDVHGDWILNHEYLRLHEISREKKADGTLAYEAFWFIEWNPKLQQYTCVLLDNTSGGGLSGPVAHAKREKDAIPFVFQLSASEAIHTTFIYDKASDSWRWTIDDSDHGKTDRFADLRMTRRR
jgi:hypothetical protein